MIYIEDKLDLFSKIVFEKIGKEIEDKKSSFQKEIMEPYYEKVKASARAAEKILDEYRKKGEQKYTQTVSRAKVRARHDILQKQREILDRVIDGLRDKCISFLSEPKYREYLKNCIGNAVAEIKSDSISFYITNKDIENNKGFIEESVRALNSNIACEFHTLSDSYLGGFICADNKEGIRLDYTLLSLIEDNRDLIAGMVSESILKQ